MVLEKRARIVRRNELAMEPGKRNEICTTLPEFSMHIAQEITRAQNSTEIDGIKPGFTLVAIHSSHEQPNETATDHPLNGRYVLRSAITHVEKMRATAKLFQTILRPYDVVCVAPDRVCRILLPMTPFRFGKIVAERLWKTLQRQGWPPDPVIKLSSYPEDGVLPEELLQILDLGLVVYCPPE